MHMSLAGVHCPLDSGQGPGGAGMKHLSIGILLIVWCLSLALVYEQAKEVSKLEELERLQCEESGSTGYVQPSTGDHVAEKNEKQALPRLSRFSEWEDNTHLELLQRKGEVELMMQAWSKQCRNEFEEHQDGLDLEICLFRAQMRTEDWMSRHRFPDRDESGIIDGQHRQILALSTVLTSPMNLEWNGSDLNITGEGLRQATAGVEGEFTMRTEGYDFGGESFYVRIVGPEVTVGVVTDEKGGLYRVRYLLGTVGTYNIEVRHEFTGYGASFMPVVSKKEDIHLPYIKSILYSDELVVTGETLTAPTERCTSLDTMTHGRYMREEGVEALYFQPWSCSWQRNWTVDVVEECVQETNLGRVLLLGDSNTEHISASITGRRGFLRHCQLEPDTCARLKEIIFLPIHKNVSTVDHSSHEKWDSLFAGEFSELTLPVEGKRNVVVWNSGLHEVVDGTLMAEYYVERQKIMERLEEFFPGPLLFRTSSAGHRQTLNGVPKIIRSITNERLRAIDELGALQTRARGHHVLDLYNITISRPDAMYPMDVRHYEVDFSGVMGVLYLNAICYAKELL